MADLRSKAVSLYWSKVGPGDYAVDVGDAAARDTFHFRTERDATRFINASGYAVKRTRAR